MFFKTSYQKADLPDLQAVVHFSLYRDFPAQTSILIQLTSPNIYFVISSSVYPKVFPPEELFTIIKHSGNLMSECKISF